MYQDEKTEIESKLKWPWWEPYVFTLFVMVGIVLFMMLCGWIGRIPMMEHVLLGVMTLVALFDFFRRQGELPSLSGKFGSSALFGFVGFIYLRDGQWLPGLAYAMMSLVWLFLLIMAYNERRKISRETIEGLDRAINSLRDFGSDPQT